jgi:hypothetical protein
MLRNYRVEREDMSKLLKKKKKEDRFLEIVAVIPNFWVKLVLAYKAMTYHLPSNQ